jgi:hypothetical protein
MAVPGQAKISHSCCRLAFSAALSTTGPADFKVAWLLGLFEKTLPGPGKIYPGLTFSSLPWALASPAADPYPRGQCTGLLTMGQFCAQVAQEPQGMISFVEPCFSLVQ